MSQREKPDWFAWHPKDFRTDDNVELMSLAQVGAYVFLLGFEWINGYIPEDLNSISRILKQSKADTELMWPGIAPCFVQHPEIPGRLINSRMEAERQICESLSERGRSNAKRRWVREDTPLHQSGICKNDASSDDVASTLHQSGNAHASSLLSLSSCSTDEVLDWFNSEFWPLYPRKVAKPQALRAARKHGADASKRALIIETLKQHLPSLSRQIRGGEDFRPYPASWLNQEHWLDGGPTTDYRIPRDIPTGPPPKCQKCGDAGFLGTTGADMRPENACDCVAGREFLRGCDD